MRRKLSRRLTSAERHEQMTTAPVLGLLVSMSLPTTATQLIMVIYNTADTWFVSQISTSASAGVGIVFALMAIIQAIGFGLAMGAGSLTSRLLGEKRDKEAFKYASSAFFAAIALGSVIMICGLMFLEPIMRFFGASDTMLPHAVAYAKYILIAAPIMCASYVMNNILRSEGDSKVAMWGMCAGGILNMALDPLFIFTFGLGTAGAAAATAISQLVSFIILFVISMKRGIVKIHIKYVSKKISDYGLIYATGIPTVFRQGLASIASAALNICASGYGDAAVAAISIANKVYMLMRNIVIGVGQGFMPIAGYNYGAKRLDRARSAFVYTCAIGTAICVISSVLVAIFRVELITWFRDDAEVVRIGGNMLLYLAAAIPFMGYSTYVNQMYQGLGYKLCATILASLRQGILFLPALFLLNRFVGLPGVCMTQSVSDILAFVIAVPFQIVFFKRVLKKDKISEA